MKLHIAGVCHFDPTGRRRLTEWLEQLSAQHPEPPAFVAVEFDAGLFAKITAQRTAFRNLMREHWPHATHELLRELELSLGFEGDTHERVFPGAKTVWLDEGRPYDEVDGVASGRLVTYHQFLGEDGLPHDTSAALSRLSQEAWRSADPAVEGDERDHKFAHRILQETEHEPADWAIAIVGAAHASDDPGRMRRLLEEVGQTCEVTILRP
jgi:hypothetical protein